MEIGGVFSPKEIEGKPIARIDNNEIALVFISAILCLPLLPLAPIPVRPD